MMNISQILIVCGGGSSTQGITMTTLRVGDKVVVKIPDRVDKITGQLLQAEEWIACVKKLNVRCMVSQLPGMIEVTIPTGGTAYIDPVWATPYVKPVRTPLTEENLLKWTEGNVARSASATDLYGNSVTNSVERLLNQILISAGYGKYGSLSRHELFELVLDWRQNGVKGYKQWTREELLQGIREEFLQGSNRWNDLEELLEFANLEPGSDRSDSL